MPSPTPAGTFERRAGIAAVAFLALAAPAHLSAQEGGRAAPGVTIRASASVVNVCPGREASARVRLRAVLDEPACAARYTWSATGGRIVGRGPEVVWDFAGTPPGDKLYDATLTVESGPGCRGPRRATSPAARVVVWGCPPEVSFAPRPAVAAPARCPVISLCCRAATSPGLLTPFSVALSGGAPGVVPKFRWAVSGGRVAEGQHTDSIAVDTTGFKGSSFLTTVEVGGFGPRCSATCTTAMTSAPPRVLTLSASVRNARDGSPVPRAKVSLFFGDAPAGEAVADEGGRFRREGLAPGRYRLVASADRFNELEFPVSLDQFFGGSVVISMSPARAEAGPAPSPPPTPSPSPTPTPGASPEASPAAGGRARELRAGDDPPHTKGWTWEPWVLGLLGVLGGAAAAYMLLKGGAAAGSLGAGAAGTTAQSDKVFCTVFGPKSAAPGDRFVTQVFAHLKEQEGELAELARRCVGASAERFVASKRMGREIARDAEIFFRLEMEGLLVGEPEQSIFWDGVIDSVTFRVKVPDDFKPGEVASNVIFGVVSDEGARVILGHVSFMFEVAAAVAAAPVATSVSAPATPPAAAERPPQTLVEHKHAFISYASPDREAVLLTVRGLMANGTECFMDKMTFQPGEDWRANISQYIEQSDVFYLFWSRHALNSEWVQREIDLALERLREEKVKPLIRPMPLESAAVVPPPEKLSHLHFDDPTLAHLDAERYRQALRQQGGPTRN